MNSVERSIHRFGVPEIAKIIQATSESSVKANENKLNSGSSVWSPWKQDLKDKRNCKISKFSLRKLWLWTFARALAASVRISEPCCERVENITCNSEIHLFPWPYIHHIKSLIYTMLIHFLLDFARSSVGCKKNKLHGHYGLRTNLRDLIT